MTDFTSTGYANPYADPEEAPDKELGIGGIAGDIAAAPFRGVLNAGVGVANLFGADIEETPWGESETAFGGFIEGVSQFLVGFIPGLGAASKIGSGLSKYASLANAGSKVAKTIGAAKAGKLVGGLKNTVASAVADFTVFDGNDPRFSNLIQAIPGIEIPVVSYLASDPDSDPGDLEERMKAVIEGAGLGLIADGIVLMFKKIKGLNKAVIEGDVETAAKLNAEVEDIAADTLDSPTSMAEVADEDLLNPETVGNRIPELENYEPKPEDFENDILGPETVSMAAVKERVGYDPNGGIVVLAKPGAPSDAVINGLTQYDDFVREPGARMQILQLKHDAWVLPGKGREAGRLLRRDPNMPEAEYRTQLGQLAKTAGYDAISFGRGRKKEVTILNRGSVLHEINVKSEESLYERRAIQQDIKIKDIVNNSRVESAIHYMDQSPEKAVEIAQAYRKAVDDPTNEHMEAFARTVNLTKLGERGNRAMFAVLTQEMNHKALVEPGKNWDQMVAEATHETARMLGSDPAIIVGRAEQFSKGVDAAANFAMGARLWFKTKLTEMQALGKTIVDWGKLTPEQYPKGADGAGLSRDAAIEMMLRNIEDVHKVGLAAAKLGTSFGRGLNSYRVGVDRMTENALMRSLELRGGDVNHNLKTINQLLENIEKGGLAHASAQLIHGTRMSRFIRMATDFYMSSLLSAPKTLTTNVIGSASTALYRAHETAMGAWLGKKLMSPDVALRFERAGRVNRARVSIMTDMLFAVAGLKKSTSGGDLRTAVNAAKRAFASGEGQLTAQSAWLDSASRRKGALTVDNLNKMTGADLKPDSGMGAGVQMFFDLMSLPSKTMASTDEFIKQVAYHSHIRAELMEQARESGLGVHLQGPGIPTPDQWVDNEMRKMTLDGQAKSVNALRAQAEEIYPRDKFDDPNNREQHIQDHVNKQLGDVDEKDNTRVKYRSLLMDRAVKFAQEVTFTTPLNPQGGRLQKFGHFLQNFADDHPTMRFFTPFIRTPLNLLAFTANRLPVPGLNKDFMPMMQYFSTRAGILPDRLSSSSKKWIQEVMSSDAEVASEAFGRATTAFGVMAGVGTMAFSGVFTGAGPADHEQRRVLEATGWQPYSIKVGDTYVSYQRLDPFAGAIALAADMADVTRFGASDQDIEQITTGYFAAVLENLSSKSYLAGVMDLFNLLSDPEANMPKTLGRIAGGFVPNAIAAARGFGDDHFDEVQGIVDRIKSRIPFLSDDVNLQRNLLGEPVNKKTFGGVLKAAEGLTGYMLPIQINTTGSDEIDNELANLAFPFRAPSHSKFGADLRDFKTEEGQTAYDRWQQLTSEVTIEGRSLRSSLGRLIGSSFYQKLDQLPVDKLDIDSPRVSMITSMVNQYRRKAELQVLKEFPELRDRTKLQRQSRELLRSGSTSTSDINSLLSGQ